MNSYDRPGPNPRGHKASLIRADKQQEHVAQISETVLTFLSRECFSTRAILQELIGYQSEAGIRKVLKRLENAELLKQHKYAEYGNKVVWGITRQGLRRTGPLEGEDRSRWRYFQPDKLNWATFQHKCAVQRAQIRTINAGYQWQRAPAIGQKRPKPDPDGIVIIDTDEQPIKIAIEFERTIKSFDAYRKIVFYYVNACHLKTYESVHYLCESQHMADRLKAIFHRLGRAQGSHPDQVFRLTPEHLDYFSFYAWRDWSPVPDTVEA